MANWSAGVTDNCLLVTDSYKVTHHLQYPENTTLVYSYFESRGGQFPSTVFFGLQYLLKRWLVGPIVTKEKIAEAKELYNAHFGNDLFNEEGWNYVLEKHGGYIPIRIKALPEGTVVPFKNVMFTVENTDPECYWLTNYFETLLVQFWYPMTVATISHYNKQTIAKYLSETSDNQTSLPNMFVDLGLQGSTSVEAAGIGGAAHLVSFNTSSTLAAHMTVKRFYGHEVTKSGPIVMDNCAKSIWESSGEANAIRNALRQHPDCFVVTACDSHDTWNAVDNIICDELKDIVIKSGDTNGGIVIKPGEGDPEEVLIKVLDIIGKKFGTVTNSKGYKVLPSYIRVMQGEGVTNETVGVTLEAMKKHKWSAENVTFSSSGALLQGLNRDTQKCAYKCSFAVINGEQVNVYKQPITDPGKNSKKGRLSLERHSNGYVTVQEGNGDPEKDLLVTVFENGRLIKDYTFEEVQRNASLPVEA